MASSCYNPDGTLNIRVLPAPIPQSPYRHQTLRVTARCGNSNALSAGLGVGLSLGIILIAALVFLAVQLLRLRRCNHSWNAQYMENSGGLRLDSMAMHWQQNGWRGSRGRSRGVGDEAARNRTLAADV
ncbi:hypothetical protein K432DRAFT_388379 [Lepidopterella palustris CBS 459.81]|uniref:Uncharacterized protein n=1 Tax=Lepidopterella palustris CBS 459.81 TaxID=1314670 RepID=A0A8E2JKF3_9PEZI|nr:hypothetical protein K432DRAFT_388379 [Lepidopterella palustris CBS 459.81]